MKVSRYATTLGAVLIAVTSLAGCSSTDRAGSDEKTAPAGQTAGPDQAAQAAKEAEAKYGPKVVEVTDTPGSVEGFVGAAQDVEVRGCTHDEKVLKVTGTIANPTKRKQQYRIYVSALNAAGITRGVMQVDVKSVDPKQTVDWKTQLDLADTDLRCVLRVERFDPQK